MSSSSLAGGRVLVTGGAGFIGTTLARELADAAEQWVVLDNLHPQVHPGSQPPADLPGSVDLRVGDVTSADDLDAVVAELRRRGVVFEDVDAPGFRTRDGIAEIEGNYPSKGARGERAAWFRDSEGNLLGIGQPVR
jgi:nucleoside-diphosphate-sugar epimerase